MILALPMWALAGEGDSSATTYDRLFGPEPEAVVAPAPASEWPKLAALGLLGAGALGAVWLKKRQPASRGVDPALRVVARQVIGDKTTLVLVDVEEPDGGRRRILVGTGNGAPVLISDLGFGLPMPEEAIEPLEPVSGRAELPC